MRIDVTPVAPAGVRHCAVDVFLPPMLPAGRRPTVLCCVPGGSMTRAYFDLAVPSAVGQYSMARHLTARGFVVVTIDPPGVGGSDVPDDPYALTPDTLADVVARVTTTVVDGLAGVDDPVVVGVGHSAGALLTVYEQARHQPFAGLALLGFAGHGLPDFLTDRERACADDPAATRAAIADLVTARFGSALPDPPAPSTSIFSGGPEPEAVKQAMRSARAPLLALLGLTSMIPGASAPELAAVDVPVLLGVGDRDITGDPAAIPGQFPAAPAVTLVVVPDAGHAHNVAPTRAVLWDRLADWASTLD